MSIKHISNITEKMKNLLWNRGIQPVFLLLHHDFKTIIRNKAALIIILGLCFLPSLYAWINIYASWDPYGNTGNLPVAIVNNDEGAVFEGQIVNVGESIVDEMKENTSINWHFVDDWQANYGLNNGQYYAMIEVPANFSKRLTSLGTATPQKPVIVYRANEKLNAIAAKITNVAKDKLVDNIKSNFVKTVNEKILVTFNDKADTSDVTEITFSDVEERLGNIHNDITELLTHLEDENTSVTKYQNHLKNNSVQMQSLLSQMQNIEGVMDAAADLNSAQTKALSQSIEIINTGIDELQNLNTQNQRLLDEMLEVNSNTVDADLTEIMNSTIDICDKILRQIKEDIKNLETLDPDEDKGSVQFAISSLVYMRKLIEEERDKLESLAELKGDSAVNGPVTEVLKTIKELSYEFSKRTMDLSAFFYNSAVPTLTIVSDNFSAALRDASDLIGAAEVIVPEYQTLATFLIATGNLTASQRTEMADVLINIDVAVTGALDKLNQLDEEKITRLIELIRDNPEEITDFLSSPLDVEVRELYEVDSFGVAITPFYTVLAIWVGVLLMSSLLSTESHFDHGYKTGHVYTAKIIFYLMISLVQSSVIILGDIHVLGVVPKDTSLMFLFGALTSVTFVAIIFTLVSVFGNVGKAIAIVIMIFQIAGSGGIYPIETNPEIFGVLMPYWPFTYAIGGFREAILGPVPASVMVNIHALLKIVAVALPIGLLKMPLHPLIHFFERKFDESDLK